MDKKTPEALLKLVIGQVIVTVERRWETSVANGTPLFTITFPDPLVWGNSDRWSV